MREMLRQLRAVGDLQLRLLPGSVPRRAGWQFAVHYAVGVWPGGDYYDFLDLPDGRLLLLIADASDQGAPSSALVAMTRVVMHSCPLSSGREQLPFCPVREPVLQPPHVLLGRLNGVLFENSLAEQFMTAFCGVLDPIDGNLHYANAGHPSPRLWRAAHRVVEPVRDAVGLPLGMERHAAYHHRRTEMGPGDVLVLYTDGLTAALDERGEMFGCARLDAALAETAGEGAEAVKDAVVSRLDAFLGGAELQDDVALVVVSRDR